MKSFITAHKSTLILNLLLLIFAFFYYLFFTHKGIVLSDEGYYVHYAERIASGQIPYKDFILQYTPGYFYLLGFLYHLFGEQLIIGRYLSMVFCLGILSETFIILYLKNISSKGFHLLAGLVMISLGYPLLHIPLVIWPCVFFVLMLEIFYLLWCKRKSLQYEIAIGIILGLLLLTRQTAGTTCFLAMTVLMFFTSYADIKTKLRTLLRIYVSWAVFTSIWIYIVFIRHDNLAGIMPMIAYGKQFLSTYPFSYPSPVLLFQPTGFFKLLPYYFPFGMTVAVAIMWWKNKKSWEDLSFSYLMLVGFFSTIYPASDLLHVYPFLGGLIVSGMILFQKSKRGYIMTVLSIIFIFIGFYMTFATKSFRYEDYFLRDTTALTLPRTQGIYVDMSNTSRSGLLPLANFINSHTKKSDYIFVYPFSPLLYFLLDRPNPTGIVQFIILEPPVSVYPEDRVLKELKEHHVKYIITDGPYVYDRKISRYIQNLPKAFVTTSYTVFQTAEE